MGSEFPGAFPRDGEGPVRQVTLSPFRISKFAVTNEQFSRFVKKTEYRTEAERFGWSFVFRNHVPAALRAGEMPGTPWWVRVYGADGRTLRVLTGLSGQTKSSGSPHFVERCAGMVRVGRLSAADRG